MHKSIKNRLDAIVLRHLEWYDRYPTQKPKPRNRRTRPKRDVCVPDRKGRPVEGGRPMWDYDQCFTAEKVRRSY